MNENPLGGRLTGKVAIVTGAGSAGTGLGNGQAVARRLAEQGARVVCADLDLARAEQTVELAVAAGGTAIAVQADATDPESNAALVAAATGAFGRLDVLVNNVGAGSATDLAGVTPEAWEQALRLNVTSAMLCSQAAAPALRAAGGGSIVNIGSTVAARYGGPWSMAYATAKAALAGLTVSLAGQLGADRIRVNLLVVGFVWSSMIEQAAIFQGPDWREERRLAGLLPEEGTPWHVADAVAFLVSEESCWITGQSLVLDGGASAR